MPPPKLAKVAIGAAITVTALGGIYAFARSPSDAAAQTTDDAYVRADFTVVAPKISGHIAQVMVEDNQEVKRGQVLALIDERDAAVAVEIAQADVRTAQAALDSARASLVRHQSVIRQADANLKADDAAVSFASANASRYRNLSTDGSGTVQEREDAETRLRIARANRDRDAAVHAGAGEETSVMHADTQRAEGALQRAQAALAAAKLNLSYTTITAPVDGMVGRRSARVGSYVSVGAPLMAVVPLKLAFVEANFRETQLAKMRPGQPVSMTVDTLPGVTFKGRVDSIAPASGVTFSAVGPENATGNFTKVVQRLPVKIRLDQGQPDLSRLRVGMSVRAKVKVDGGA